MARHDDRYRVVVQRVPGGPGRARTAGLLRELSVRRHLAVRDARRRVENLAAESGGERPVDGDVERPPASGEVLVQLAAHVVETRGRLEHSWRDTTGQVTKHVVDADRRQRELHEPRVRRGSEERTER